MEKENLSDILELDGVKIDLARENRTGFPEVIFGAGKSAETIAQILLAASVVKPRTLVTRLSPDKFKEVQTKISRADTRVSLDYNSEGQVLIWGEWPNELRGSVAIVSAGTSDRKVVLESEWTCRFLGIATQRFEDVGVAGISRLFRELPQIETANVVIAIAGFEGALPSVIAGLVKCPVIAVPTSVGYGCARGGETALFSMLSSCSSGMTVVGIDNGFGAAIAASRIFTYNAKAAKEREG